MAGPFVEMACGNEHPDLIHASLFGSVRGAFTSAINRPGLVKTADGGTLLVDDIDCLTLESQAAFLALVGDGHIRHLGEDGRLLQSDVRVIATTNKDLAAMVRTGRFREDLWYRLRTFQMRMPPLRERPEDIRAIALCLLATKLAEYGDNAAGYGRFTADGPLFDQEMLSLFEVLPWPANIRDLESAIKHIALSAEPNDSGVYDLPGCARVLFDPDHVGGGFFGFAHPVDEPEQIRRILRLTRWNKALAARIIGWTRPTLHRLINAQGWREP